MSMSSASEGHVYNLFLGFVFRDVQSPPPVGIQYYGKEQEQAVFFLKCVWEEAEEHEDAERF